MKKTMAVYDSDPFYAERLSDYVNRKETGMFQAQAFTSKEKLEAYMKEHGVDVTGTGLGFGGVIRERFHSLVFHFWHRITTISNSMITSHFRNARSICSVVLTPSTS